MVWHTTIGNGPTKVVVIHGWFWDHRVFAPIFDCLDADRTTYAFIDIRGYGNSRNLSGKYSIGEVAADAIALADQLGWHEFHVVGHSMGAKAAQKVAMDAGARVRSVVAASIHNSIRMRKSRRSAIPGTIQCRKHRSILRAGCRPSFNRRRNCCEVTAN